MYEPPGVTNITVPRSLAGKAVLEDYRFPLSVNVGVEYPIRLLVHNVGSDGVIAGGVVNETGNPGSFTIIGDTGETVVRPGMYIRTASTSPVVNCIRIDINKKIRFSAGGTYSLRLWAMHEEAGKWFFDQEVPLVVTVAAEEPHTFPIHLFDNLKLKAEWWDVRKSKSNSIIDIDPTLLQSAKLDYTVQYTQGTPFAESANIDFDGTKIVTENLSKGEAKSGSIDLTGLIGRSATVTIWFDSAPGFWSEVLFDVWVTLVYREAPPVDPTTPPFNWDEFINKYGKWIALGFTGFVVLYIMRRPAGPIIVMPGGRT